MSSSDRIEKFHEDSVALIKLQNVTKLITEIKKLSVLMQKHQTQIVPDNHKQKLLSTLELYYTYLNSLKRNDISYDALHDVIYKLADDYLKLPEGKLVHSKGKKKILKWIDTLIGKTKGDTSGNNYSAANKDSLENVCYTVVDVNLEAHTVTLSEFDSCENIIEGIDVELELFRKIHLSYEVGDEVLITLDNNNGQPNNISNYCILKVEVKQMTINDNIGREECQSQSQQTGDDEAAVVLYVAPAK